MNRVSSEIVAIVQNFAYYSFFFQKLDFIFDFFHLNSLIGQNCVDRDFCSALQNSGKKCDAELKELCPNYCGLCDDDEVPLPRQGGQRRHGEDRHTKGTKSKARQNLCIIYGLALDQFD